MKIEGKDKKSIKQLKYVTCKIFFVKLRSRSRSVEGQVRVRLGSGEGQVRVRKVGPELYNIFGFPPPYTDQKLFGGFKGV